MAGKAKGSLYFRQLLCGRDVARPHEAKGRTEELVFQVAQQMANFAYLVGCREKGECVVVDGCYDVAGIEREAEKDGMAIVGAVATHCHWDHIGGEPPAPFNTRFPGLHISGLKDLMAAGRPGYIHEREWNRTAASTGLDDEEKGRLNRLRDGSRITVGDTTHLEFIHTPGHSPGSLCILVKSGEGAQEEGESKVEAGGATQPQLHPQPQLLISGDTVFPGSCGRVDLEGSDATAMFHSLQRLARELPDDLAIYPGHAYGGDKSTVAREKAAGLLAPLSKEEWDRSMGRPKL